MRGENSFINLPGFGARLYNHLTQIKAIQLQFEQVAQDLATRIEYGRLLDIGTGPGRLLLELHRLNPNIELYGLDLAASMIKVARKNLAGIRVDLRCGNIQQTDYEGYFFDLVTCTGSFYLWNQPIKGLEEIFRILKVGRSAFLFETYQDFQSAEFQATLRANLRQENFLRQLITPILLRKQLRMTYRLSEIGQLFEQTSFADSYTIEPITLAGLPIWLLLTLTKPPC